MNRLAEHRVWVDGAITIAATVSIAAAGLVLEDHLPLEKDGVRAAAVHDPWRIAWLAGGLAILLLLLTCRDWLTRRRGTLYYLRVLDEWMADWHLDQERSRRGGYVDERVVSYHISAPRRDGVVDIADDLVGVGQAIQATMNEDDISTGFHVAPNLIWPAAVAIGYGFFPFPDVSLLELGQPHGAEPMEWRLDDDAPASGFATVSVRSALPDRVANARTVLVTADLTGRGSTTLPPGLQPDLRIRIAAFATPSGPINEENRGVLVHSNPDAPHPPEMALVHPAAAAEIVTTTLAAALHDHPEAQVYVVLRVPKSVAVAVGHRLSGPGRAQRTTSGAKVGCGPCAQESCRHPWTRLILLVPEQGPQREFLGYYALRVHPGQPSADEIAQRARRDGLVLMGAVPPATSSTATPCAVLTPASTTRGGDDA